MEKNKNFLAIVGEEANTIIQQLISALCGSSDSNERNTSEPASGVNSVDESPEVNSTPSDIESLKRIWLI